MRKGILVAAIVALSFVNSGCSVTLEVKKANMDTHVSYRSPQPIKVTASAEYILLKINKNADS